MVCLPRLLVALIAAAHFPVAAQANPYRVTVPSAPVDRAAQVLVFTIPGAAAGTGQLTRGGESWPVQIEAGGRATSLLPFQKAGEALMFDFAPAARTPASPAVAVETAKGALRVSVRGQPAFAFQMDREALPRPDIKPEFKRAGYLHPVYSPSGKILTDDYPSNHVHHHGIWTPWVKTRFQGRAPDFWNMGTKTGAEDFVGLDRSWNGSVHGGFEARLQMVDLSANPPVVALHEKWLVHAYDVPVARGLAPMRVFDLVITQTCATADPVQLPAYHYGGFGIRGADPWNGPGDAALFLTSEGETDRIKGNNTRGRWCYLGGKVDGAIAGTAVLGHPANFRSPQPLRLHPNMPYFSFVPQQLGDFAIEPGQPYVARFRFVTTDGPADRAALEALWQGYATPAVATVDSRR